MKKKLGTITLIFAVLSLAGMSQEMSLDQVLESYYRAEGLANMKDWQSLIGTAKMIGQPVETPVKFFIKRPDKVRVEAEVQGSKMIQALDGNIGWSVIPWSGSSDPQDMTADELKMIKTQADMEGPLYDWKAKGHKAELLGKEDLEGTSVYKVKLTKADGDIDTYYIDADSFLPLKMTAITKIQGNESESEVYFSNYGDVHGILMARTVTSKYKGSVTSTIQIEKIEVNPPVNDSLFVKPVKK